MCRLITVQTVCTGTIYAVCVKCHILCLLPLYTNFTVSIDLCAYMCTANKVLLPPDRFTSSIHLIFLLQMLPLSTNIKDAFKNGLDEEQFFIQNLALFLCTVLKEHDLCFEKRVRQYTMHTVLS